MKNNIIIFFFIFISLFLISCKESIKNNENNTDTPNKNQNGDEVNDNENSSNNELDENHVKVSFYDGKELITESIIEKGNHISRKTLRNKIGTTFIGFSSDKINLFDFENTIVNESINLYSMYEYVNCELPIVSIITEDYNSIESKKEYNKASFNLQNSNFDMENVSCGIRGRGNSTWEFPKKGYRIKFDKKQSMFGSSYKAKSWTLIPNYDDLSMARNYLALEMSKEFGMPFTSTHEYVEVYLNNNYLGVYLLCDQIQTGSGRVDIDEGLDTNDIGFLVEVNARIEREGTSDIDYFIGHDSKYYEIKTPDTEDKNYLNDSNTYINIIKNYMNNCIDAINGNDWTRITELIDVDSFVNSYIINELFANIDVMNYSTYFYKDKGSKLYCTPLWDFDISSGNVNYGYGNEDNCPSDFGLWAGLRSWYRDLLKFNEFKTLVITRLTEKEEAIKSILNFVNSDKSNNIYSLYKNSIDRNFTKWQLFGVNIWPNPKSVVNINNYVGHIDYLYNWLDSRLTYLKGVYKNGVE